MRTRIAGTYFWDIPEVMKCLEWSYSFTLKVARKIGKKVGKKYLIEETALADYLKRDPA